MHIARRSEVIKHAIRLSSAQYGGAYEVAWTRGSGISANKLVGKVSEIVVSGHISDINRTLTYNVLKPWM